MAYNSKYTGAQVEALLDRAGEAPQTYDIGWLLNLLANGTPATLTEAQFNEVKAAAEAGKIFTYGGVVLRQECSSMPYAGGTIDLVDICSIPGAPSKEGSLTYMYTFYVSVSRQTSAYGDMTFEAAKSHYRLLDKSSLSEYAKASVVPTKTSQLTNDSGFITADDVAIPGKTVVKTYEDKIGYDTDYYYARANITLAADEFHIVGRCYGLTITLPEGADTDGQEYCCQFYIGTSAFTLALPSTVYIQNGEWPEFESNTCCQLVIVNNCAVVGMFKASE